MTSKKVCADWEQRQFTTDIELSIAQLVEFLNTFDRRTRSKLANIQEKLTKLESAVEHAETAIRISKDAAAATQQDQ